jgi:hypothetical protein
MGLLITISVFNSSYHFVGTMRRNLEISEWMGYVFNHAKLIKPFFSSLLSHSGMAHLVTKHTFGEGNLCKFIKLKKYLNTILFLFQE